MSKSPRASSGNSVGRDGGGSRGCGCGNALVLTTQGCCCRGGIGAANRPSGSGKLGGEPSSDDGGEGGGGGDGGRSPGGSRVASSGGKSHTAGMPGSCCACSCCACSCCCACGCFFRGCCTCDCGCICWAGGAGWVVSAGRSGRTRTASSATRSRALCGTPGMLRQASRDEIEPSSLAMMIAAAILGTVGAGPRAGFSIGCSCSASASAQVATVAMRL